MELEEIWSQAKEIVTSGLEENDAIHVFIDMLSPFGMFGDQIVLTTSSDQVASWVNKNLNTRIKAAILAITDKEYAINVTVVPSSEPDQQPAQAEQSVSTPVERPQGPTSSPQPDWMMEYYGEGQGSRVAAPQRTQQHSTNVPVQRRNSGNEALFSKCTFESFVQGPSNKFAYSAAMAVAEQPGSMWNPLFIYGDSGLGKTHLLVAIANYISNNFPRMATTYVSANDFLNDYVEGAMGGDWGGFNSKYQNADVLLVDDVQYLEGKDETINQLFNIFNKMTGEYKQVVLSADRAPKDIDMDDRIRSRFIQGMLVDVKPPDYETRLAIIRNSYLRAQQSTALNVLIPDDVLEYLAESATSNIREMEGAVTRLIGHVTLFNKQSITVDEAREVLQDFFPEAAAVKVEISTIQSEVEHFFKISHEDLISSKRLKGFTHPRHIAIYLSRYMTSESLESIGKKFGGRDHTTIMHSVNKIEREQKDNRQLFDEIEQLTARIQERSH